MTDAQPPQARQKRAREPLVGQLLAIFQAQALQARAGVQRREAKAQNVGVPKAQLPKSRQAGRRRAERLQACVGEEKAGKVQGAQRRQGLRREAEGRRRVGEARRWPVVASSTAKHILPFMCDI